MTLFKDTDPPDDFYNQGDWCANRQFMYDKYGLMGRPTALGWFFFGTLFVGGAFALGLFIGRML